MKVTKKQLKKLIKESTQESGDLRNVYSEKIKGLIIQFL